MKNLVLLTLSALLPVFALQAQDNPTTVTKKAENFEEFNKFRFGGYGEMAASYYDYGFNRMMECIAVVSVEEVSFAPF